MTTGINGCQNDSDRWVSVVNNENSKDSRICRPHGYTDVYLWISQQGDTRPSVQTKKGLMWIQDDDWRIMGQWEWSDQKVQLAKVESQPQDYLLTITADGDIRLSEK
ncbi:hypothetical protein ACIHCQ_39340 [Streptomyces sp. NPDC052236]|uniref:hypothetical protein n=1 Tax=Streptomyces sp. NPDC052236 TaxID=3365686 RepID=UPI0037D074BA